MMAMNSNSNNVAPTYRDILLNKVSAVSMAQNIKALGLQCKADPTTKDQIDVLHSYFAQAEKRGVMLVDCTVCKGMSSEELDACPYCGVGDEEEATDDSQEVVAAEEEDVIEVEERTETHVIPKEVEKPKRRRKVEAKEATVESGQMEIVVSAPKVDERELDAACARVHAIMADGAVTCWQLGQAIEEIYSKQLWKQRTRNNKPAYRGFDAFIHDEFKMTAQHARNMMDVAQKFSEAQVRQFGATKLTMLLKAPEIEQARIMDEKISQGASVREVRDEVKKARKQHGAGGAKPVTRKKRGISTDAATKAAAKNKGEEKITVAKILGRERIPLHLAASVKAGHPKPAKRLGDEPVGQMELANDVVMHFSISQNQEGELILIVNTKRVD